MTAKINADTTEEQILAGVEHGRRSIAELAGADTRAESLGDAVNSLARSEGVARASISYLTALQGSDRNTALNHVISTLVLPGANDGWSGRGNDVRRATYDGILSFVNDARWWT